MESQIEESLDLEEQNIPPPPVDHLSVVFMRSVPQIFMNLTRNPQILNQIKSLKINSFEPLIQYKMIDVDICKLSAEQYAKMRSKIPMQNEKFLQFFTDQMNKYKLQSDVLIEQYRLEPRNKQTILISNTHNQMHNEYLHTMYQFSAERATELLDQFKYMFKRKQPGYPQLSKAIQQMKVMYDKYVQYAGIYRSSCQKFTLTTVAQVEQQNGVNIITNTLDFYNLVEEDLQKIVSNHEQQISVSIKLFINLHKEHTHLMVPEIIRFEDSVLEQLKQVTSRFQMQVIFDYYIELKQRMPIWLAVDNGTFIKDLAFIKARIATSHEFLRNFVLNGRMSRRMRVYALLLQHRKFKIELKQVQKPIDLDNLIAKYFQSDLFDKLFDINKRTIPEDLTRNEWEPSDFEYELPNLIIPYSQENKYKFKPFTEQASKEQLVVNIQRSNKKETIIQQFVNKQMVIKHFDELLKNTEKQSKTKLKITASVLSGLMPAEHGFRQRLKIQEETEFKMQNKFNPDYKCVQTQSKASNVDIYKGGKLGVQHVDQVHIYTQSSDFNFFQPIIIGPDLSSGQPLSELQNNTQPETPKVKPAPVLEPITQSEPSNIITQSEDMSRQSLNRSSTLNSQQSMRHSSNSLRRNFPSIQSFTGTMIGKTVKTGVVQNIIESLQVLKFATDEQEIKNAAKKIKLIQRGNKEQVIQETNDKIKKYGKDLEQQQIDTLIKPFVDYECKQCEENLAGVYTSYDLYTDLMRNMNVPIEAPISGSIKEQIDLLQENGEQFICALEKIRDNQKLMKNPYIRDIKKLQIIEEDLIKIFQSVQNVQMLQKGIELVRQMRSRIKIRLMGWQQQFDTASTIKQKVTEDATDLSNALQQIIQQLSQIKSKKAIQKSLDLKDVLKNHNNMKQSIQDQYQQVMSKELLVGELLATFEKYLENRKNVISIITEITQ
ncbi:Conserved_hypothetical protein [Hexamita inflata]|uniref:Uncharacterized protein n=1 Tax=Hexamita inflata TaxID=28002 RepID=A0AA86TVC5_9EUKA|nr:Conserved hypothetical protein [Hexamita inflata]